MKAGFNNSTVRTRTGGFDYDYRAGFYTGIQKSFFLSESIHLQPEIYFSQQGGNSAFNLILDYVNLPVLIKIRMDRSERKKKSFITRIDGLAGPMLGYLMSAREKSHYGVDKIYRAYKHSQLMIVAGEELRFRGSLGMDLRVSWGLTDISKSSISFYKNKMVQIGLTYLLTAARKK